MATYNAKTISNLFKVKDPEQFKLLLKKISCGFLHQEENKQDEFTIYSENDEGWGYYDEEEDEEGFQAYHSLDDLCDQISSHLVDGEIAILTEIGNEKTYFNGISIAVNSKGDTVHVCLDEIHQRLDKLKN